MHDRLTSFASRLRSLPPLAVAGALAATTAAAAGTVTVRLHDAAPDAAAHAPRVEAAASRIMLPPPPAPAGLAPGTTAKQRTAARPAPRELVAAPRHLIEATLLVTSDHAIKPPTSNAISRLPGVTHTETVSAGHARLDHHRANVLGVNPSSFRAWTPSLTEKSQALWNSIASGEVTASFDMGQGAKLPLGATVPVVGRHRVPIRLGAFASVGMAGVDAVMSMHRADQVGLHRGTGLVVSAPHADALHTRDAIRTIVGNAANVSLLRQVVVVRAAGEFIANTQLNTVLHAAASRIGKPYVWGATGPDSFDCSGLVQWSFAQAGIRMPRVSEEQWFAGPHVPYSDARPGDLLFWHNDPTDPGNIDHVAIYVGNGMMIAAPHTGTNVTYEPVYMTNFAGVVRVDPATASAVGW